MSNSRTVLGISGVTEVKIMWTSSLVNQLKVGLLSSVCLDYDSQNE